MKSIWNKILWLFFFIPVYTNGQKPVFTPGFTVGLNTSQVSGDDLSGFNQFGVYGGLSLNAEINEKKSFQFQIAFSQKGSRKASIPNGNNNIYILRLNYIDVPIIYHHRFQKDKFNDFHGEIGIVNSYLINYNERNFFGNVSPVRPFNKYEGSFLIGFGYWVKHGAYFSLRFVNSILPIRKHMSGATYYLNLGQYNSVVQFSLNYFFNKKKE